MSVIQTMHYKQRKPEETVSMLQRILADMGVAVD